MIRLRPCSSARSIQRRTLDRRRRQRPRGVGMSIIPLPKRDIFGGTSTSRGSCDFSNFARHEVRLVNLVFIPNSILHLRSDAGECLELAEEAYARNAMRTRIQAKREIVHGYAAEREHREIIDFAGNI